MTLCILLRSQHSQAIRDIDILIYIMIYSKIPREKIQHMTLAYLILHQTQFLADLSPLHDLLALSLAGVIFRLQGLHQHACVEESVCDIILSVIVVFEV